MAWTALTFAFGSKLTSTKMTQLQANFAAMAAGDAGAPGILEALAVRVVEVTHNITTGSTYENAAEVEIWVPKNITTLNCRLLMKGSLASVHKMRMGINGTWGNPTADSTSTAEAQFDITVDPDSGDKGSWQTLIFQVFANNDANDITINKDEFTVSGIQRNFAGASYWS